MEISPSENIIRLRELSEKLYAVDIQDDYKEMMTEIKNIVETSKEEISVNSTPKAKVKCYEKMCTTITNLLLKIK
jgi:predicted RNA-binding protein